MQNYHKINMNCVNYQKHTINRYTLVKHPLTCFNEALFKVENLYAAVSTKLNYIGMYVDYVHMYTYDVNNFGTIGDKAQLPER